MRTINKIIVHCSDSEFGDVELLDDWHRRRGWDGIGYHHVILNGRLTYFARYRPDNDGTLQVGRPIGKIGAHCRGHNQDSIGVCLIGSHHFSQKQFFALEGLIIELQIRFGVPIDGVRGHNEFNGRKTCPNFDVLRRRR